MTTEYDKIAADYPHDVRYLKYIDEPTFFHLLGELTGKARLDVGCGRGEHAKSFKQMGAISVVGGQLQLPLTRTSSRHWRR